MYTLRIYKKAFVLPAFLLYFTLFILPSFIGVYYSLTNWNAISENIKFIGLDNYIEVFKDAGNFVYIKNTIIYAVFTSLFKGILALAAALVLNEGIKTKNILRTIYFMPIIISNLILGLMFQQVFHPTNGLLNVFLNYIGLGFLGQAWIGDPTFALWSCIAVDIWKGMGFNMAIFLAGLQLIPKEMYEVCEIDGANFRNKLTKLIIPYLMPSIIINMLLNIISGLKVFDLIFCLTNGGPGRATEVLNLTVFTQFSMGNYGYGTALGVIMFVFLAIVSLGFVRLFSRPGVND